MGGQFTKDLAATLFPRNEFMGKDQNEGLRLDFIERLEAAFPQMASKMERLPGIRDLIEFSRAIHAEMAALLEAAREGISTVQSTLFVTTFPCHNCARHLVAAGVQAVEYIEPYDKSLAYELHSDAIAGDSPAAGSDDGRHMVIRPFTGVGPRMYDDFFVKRGTLKGVRGKYQRQSGGIPVYAVRLKELGIVEAEAVKMVPKLGSEV